MNGGDHIVKLCEDFVGKVERSVPSDVTLGPGEEVDAIVGCVVISYASELRSKTLLVETICLNGTLAVIGNAQVLHPQLLSGGGHLFERGPTVTVHGVAMKSSPEVRPFNQIGKASAFGGFHLASILTKLGLDVGETECSVDISLEVNIGKRLLELPALRSAKAILIERPASLQGARPHADIMLFAAGEIVEGKRIFGSCYRAQIALDSRNE